MNRDLFSNFDVKE